MHGKEKVKRRFGSWHGKQWKKLCRICRRSFPHAVQGSRLAGKERRQARCGCPEKTGAWSVDCRDKQGDKGGNHAGSACSIEQASRQAARSVPVSVRPVWPVRRRRGRRRTMKARSSRASRSWHKEPSFASVLLVSLYQLSPGRTRQSRGILGGFPHEQQLCF